MKHKKTLTALLALVVVLAAGGIGGLQFYKSNLEPVSHVDHVINFEILEGATSDQILSALEDQYLIKNKTVAKLLMKKAGLHDFKAGTYELNQAWDVKQILEKLNDPNGAISDSVAVTIQEGLWAKDIALKISENTNVGADELIALWNDSSFLNEAIERYEFLSNDILNSEYPVALEGYLYPETYFFFRETTAEEITYRILDEFDQQYQSLKNELAESGMSMHELVTLSSVVQFESGKVDDMKMIAGIFKNRLENNYLLQSSVTVCYALYEYDDWFECESNYMIDSPYNTYIHEGLPVGPICNPGFDAMNAVLNPTESDYYYFIADVYGDRSVYYATTFEEHQANVDKYLNK